jgi:HEAT repeat protein
LVVITYILKHGKVAARRIGAEALSEFAGAAANELVLRLLDDDDALVRTAAARQLRPRNLPGAIERLVSLLDSRHPGECEAARAGLAEFTLERFAANFDDLTPTARASAGALVRRVDATALPRIKSELCATARGSRKLALEWAVALDVVSQLEEPIAALLQDEDQYLRIDAIRALATNPTPRVLQYLRDALLDPYPLVQQAAEAAVRDVNGRSDTVSLTADSSRDTRPMYSPQTAAPPEFVAEATA